MKVGGAGSSVFNEQANHKKCITLHMRGVGGEKET